MKFYNATKPQYLDTDKLGIGLGTRLLQVKDKEVSSLLLHQRSKYNDRPQTPSCYSHERGGSIITKNTVHSTKNTSIQDTYTI